MVATVYQAMKSNDYTLWISDGAPTTPVFTKVAALTDLTQAFTKASIDTTTKDTLGWAAMLPGGGQKSVKITASGMAQNATTQETFKQKALDPDNNWNFQIKDHAGNTWTGSFHIASYTETGGVNNVQTFSLEMASNGAIVYVPSTT